MKGQLSTPQIVGVLVLVGVVVAVLVIVFLQQVTKTTSETSNITEQVKPDFSRCEYPLLGRDCFDPVSGSCPQGMKRVPGMFKDCKDNKICCMPKAT